MNLLQLHRRLAPPGTLPAPSLRCVEPQALQGSACGLRREIVGVLASLVISLSQRVKIIFFMCGLPFAFVG
jgi:hypothetical protein